MNNFERFQRTLLVILIAIGCFYGGYYFGNSGYVFQLRKNPIPIEIKNKTALNTTVDFQLFWDVWNDVTNTYLERPVDPQKMMYGAIQGMVASLGDPYTSFLPPKVNEAVNGDLNGEYKGIGAELGMKDGILIIAAPMEGSPAKAAGLKAGDYILSINDESTAGISISEAVSKIRGEAGTAVTLKVQTDKNDPREVKITRGTINVPSITWEDKGDGVAYIKLSRFGDDTNTEWSKIVSEINIKMKDLDSVILDVRGNPGGYLTAAVYIGEEFFRDKPVLYEESDMGKQTPSMAKRVGVFQKLPAVYVLIDEGSASASEIIAAALHDNIGAVLIGNKSFGKGTIQTAKDYEDGSGVHITIAKWLTPKKEWVHKKGIEPDIKVDRTDDDFNNNRDPQLDKALELAKQI
ncbi:S41 family peptidase [candidate division WWE3 bacterium]|uniref:S41 family peptidase n=1 Tax=candidate division WWE3 bacterium TaxID=2053526 RepID=A0A7X9HGX7_UNCKA|nr:S41 family peptidase [candidate division WWE3 bacterium]